MNYRLLSRVLGLLLLLLSLTMLSCLAYAYHGDVREAGIDAVESFWLSIAVTSGCGGMLFYAGRNAGREILRREAVAIVGLGWIECALFGALPYLLCSPGLGPADALFESMSGFTTTGASVIPDLDLFPRSILLWRGFTQWLGGLGILVLFVALLSHLGAGNKSLLRHDAFTRTGGEGIQARIRGLAHQLWQIYVVLSVVCCAGLMAFGMSFYDALAHSFTAISTAGFSTRNDNIGAYGSLGIELWLMLFMILGGLSFMLHASLVNRRWKRWSMDEETPVFLCILFAAIALITLDLWLLAPQTTWQSARRAAAFQTVSILTTTGYTTVDYNGWPAFSRVLLLLMMLVGGCAASTAGGFKISRALLFFKFLRTGIIGSFRPHQVIGVHLNGRVVDDSSRFQTLFFIALGFTLLGLGTVLISLVEPRLDMVSSFGAVVATLFNVGQGVGAVGPGEGFGHLAGHTKLILCLLMLLGRLEFIAVLVLFFPSLWKQY